jgi:hypothetical protein
MGSTEPSENIFLSLLLRCDRCAVANRNRCGVAAVLVSDGIVVTLLHR